MSRFALIPAAGSGSRLAGELPKQYLPLGGKPMLWHTVRALCVPQVETVFAVLAPGDVIFAAQDWSAFGAKLEPLYCGGRTRHESVANGLKAGLKAADMDLDDWVLVHDAARPCLAQNDLRALIDACENDPVGGILALRVADTVKRADAEGRIEATQSRDGLWLAQTPQMFRAGLLIEALGRAAGEVTDEASAVEAMGPRPRLVPGNADNIKVTWPSDLALAEAILAAR